MEQGVGEPLVGCNQPRWSLVGESCRLTDAMAACAAPIVLANHTADTLSCTGFLEAVWVVAAETVKLFGPAQGVDTLFKRLPNIGEWVTG